MIGGPTSEASDADGTTSRAEDAALEGPGVVVDGSDAAALHDGGARRLSALIVDWGGVLTSPLDSAMTTWASQEGIDFAHFADVMRTWVGGSGPGPVASGGGGGVPAAGGAGTGGAGATDADGVDADGVDADGAGESDTEGADPDGAGAGETAAQGVDPDGAAADETDAEGVDAGGAGAGEGDAESVDAGGAGVPDGDAPRVDAGTDAGGPSGRRPDPLAAVGEVPRDPASDPAVLAELEDAARRGLVPASPVHALERGEIRIEDFERLLAAALGERGSVVQAEGLLTRVLSGLAELRDDMLGLVRRARHAGIRTALLSNSWGEHYPEEEWEGAFDVVVISGRVGMRKPEAEIFRHTADLLGVPVDECVMVDDLAANIHGAVAAGMVGVLHKSYEITAEELEILFDRRLR
jgi:HAD superfamily hydrolase (TIGR01509 family)